MKKLVEVIEVQGEGLLKLMNEQVTLWCLNYIYTGKLIGVNEEYVLLSDASVVYETGHLSDGSGWKRTEEFKGDWYVMIGAIESFGVMKKAKK